MKDVAGSAEQVEVLVGERLDRAPLAIMLDIDGTLAPIAATPENAFVPLETSEIVRRLARLPDVHLALVSGRAVDDARKLLDVEGAWIIGNHGLETRTPGGELTAVPGALAFEARVADAHRALESLSRETPGALVENKRWTLTLHYRLSDERMVPALVAAAREIAHQHGLDARLGKKVVELRPPIAVNKGTASLALAGRVGALGSGSLLYAGDDQTDEDAFLALRKAMRDAVTIRVMGTAEDQGAAVTEAEYSLVSTDELRRVLEWLLARRTA
jgi:trehalose 6-phosphate synthase/phosphatase